MRTHGRAAPYAHEAHARKVRLMAPPKNLLGWFLEAYRAEMPEKLHSAGLWRDQVSGGERRNDIEPVGGSLIGTPQADGRFRLLTEGSPFHTEVAEYEGHKDPHNHYTFPLRAALARLAGREPNHGRYGFMAHALLTVARLDGDWDQALSSLGVNPEAVRRVYLEVALRTLYERYEPEPVARAA
jgi:hypothetical protein